VTALVQFLAERSKAIRGMAVTLVGALSLVIVGNESFADVTVAEWLIVAGAVLGTGLTVERTENRDAEPAPTGRHAAPDA
jgi:hypothetical protein